MPILSAAFRPDEVVGRIAEGDARGGVVVCAVTDPLDTVAVADAEEDDNRGEVATADAPAAGTESFERSIVAALVAPG